MKFFKKRKLEGAFLNNDVETLKAEIREKDEIIIYLKEIINRDLNEQNIINLLIDNYGWNISTETGYNTTFPETVKFGSVVMKLKKSYCFDMNNHLKEILNKEN